MLVLHLNGNPSGGTQYNNLKKKNKEMNCHSSRIHIAAENVLHTLPIDLSGVTFSGTVLTRCMQRVKPCLS